MRLAHAVDIQANPAALVALLARGRPGANGCRLWPGRPTRNGYGRAGYLGRVYYVHRLAYALANGPVPAGLSLLHSCDMPPCFLPEHVNPGTQADNNRDRERKGRGVYFRGENHPVARLSNADAASIRERYRRGNGALKRVLAAEFGVSPSWVAQIGNGRKRVTT